MKNHTFKKLFVPSLCMISICSLLTACGGGGSNASSTQNPPATESPTNFAPPIIVTSEMQYARADHQAVKLNDGRVFIVGGAGETSEVYDPDTNSWSDGPTASGFCSGADSRTKAQLLNDGRVMVICGYQTSIYIYDLDLNTVDVVAQMSHSRNGASVTKLADGKLLIAGGVNETSYLSGHRYQDAEIFNPADNSLSAPLNQMTYGKANQAAILDATGRVFLFGGTSQPHDGTNFDIFQTWSAFNAVGGIFENRSSAHPFLLPSGDILLVGGTTEVNGLIQPSLLVENYHSNGSGSEKDPLPRGFYEAASGQLGDGSPVISGGDSVTNGTGRDEIYVYNLLSEKFELAGSMQERRQAHTLTVLDNGDLLVTGGWGPGGTLKSAERLTLQSSEEE